MDDKLRAALRAALDPSGAHGAASAAAGASMAVVPPVRSDAAHGLASAATSLAEFQSGALASEVVWDADGVCIERAQRSGFPQLFSVRWSAAEHGPPTAHVPVRCDDMAAEAYLALGPHDVATVPRRGGAAGSASAVALAFGVDAAGALGVAAGPSPYALAPMASLTAPLAQWLAPDAPAWLATVVRAAQASKDPYVLVSAAGTIQRLQDDPAPAQTFRALLAGEGLTHGPTAWFADLSAAQHDTVAALAQVAAENLLDALRTLDEGDLAGETVDVVELIEVLHARDDLEGVRVLFAAATGASPLDPLLGFVDRAGLRLRACAPLPSVAADPRLATVSAADPDSWWSLTPEDLLP